MYSIYDDTEASSHKRAKTSPSPCSWARPALTTSPPHLSREVRLQTGWKYHAVPKLMPKLSQERIFAPFAEYTCTEYSCGMAQASSRRQGAGRGPVYQIEVIRYPIWLKQRTRKWLLTAAPISIRKNALLLFQTRLESGGCENVQRWGSQQL